ncbi:MAG TPA: hypothetical protein VEG40_10660 [Gaiellaceae bacterium]|nr:hypothetical protein [Gaiellaceae bacterium]HYA08408.1 hypothetical protein [Gaiellaceae bacterium]
MIEVVIDELVVRGLPPGDAHAAAAALETRLAALAAEGEVRPRAEAFRKLAPVTGDSPSALGDAVAGAVWGAVSR